MTTTKKLSIILGFWTAFFGFIWLAFWHPDVLFVLSIVLPVVASSVWIWNILSGFGDKHSNE
jgi:hypothetical protein